MPQHTDCSCLSLIGCSCGVSGGELTVDRGKGEGGPVWGAESWVTNHFPIHSTHVVAHCRERKKRGFPLAGFGSECLIESLCLGHLWMSEVGMKGSIYSPTAKGSGAIIRPCFVCVVKIFKVFCNGGYTAQSRGTPESWSREATLFWPTCQENVTDWSGICRSSDAAERWWRRSLVGRRAGVSEEALSGAERRATASSFPLLALENWSSYGLKTGWRRLKAFCNYDSEHYCR